MSGKEGNGKHVYNAQKKDDWLEDPTQVTPERIEEELAAIARMTREGQGKDALFREAALHGHVLSAVHLGLVSGDVATLCARRANFRLLP